MNTKETIGMLAGQEIEERDLILLDAWNNYEGKKTGGRTMD